VPCLESGTLTPIQRDPAARDHRVPAGTRTSVCPTPRAGFLREVGRWLVGVGRVRGAGPSGFSRVVDLFPLRQRPPFKPCVRFSRTRLSDIVHRVACVVCQRIVPVRR
jgi:hypothetical protein